MNATLQDVMNAASALPIEDRAALAQHLLRSLDDDEESDVRPEWLAVAEQRMDEIKSGTVVGVSADEVLRTLPGRRS
jgi:putative addiction module component (TIGR02574 family)